MPSKILTPIYELTKGSLTSDSIDTSACDALLDPNNLYITNLLSKVHPKSDKIDIIKNARSLCF